jgi:hypothetical protein
MIPKEFDSISKEDIEALVASAVSEGRTIDYNQQLPAGTDDDKREFLADASSFANAGGGDLIFGVREKRDASGKPTGIPEAADGLAGVNADAEKRRLEDVLRNGIDPRIPGVRLKHIDGFVTGPVIVARVPKNWTSPHMVTYKNLSRFFSRTSAGKQQLDVREIRAAFTASESLSERMTAFRADRVAKLLASEGPLRLEPNPKVILHLLPVGTFAEAMAVDLKAAQMLSTRDFQPMGSPDSYGPGFNFDGYLVSGDIGKPPSCYTYVQLFRNGMIEAVWTRFTREKALLIGALEREIIEAVPRYLKLLRNLGIEPPLFVAVSLVGVIGLLIITSDEMQWRFVSRPIDRDVLLLPEALIEESESNISELLRPTLDAIWQASGWPRSLGYDETGKRIRSVNYAC